MFRVYLTSYFMCITTIHYICIHVLLKIGLLLLLTDHLIFKNIQGDKHTIYTQFTSKIFFHRLRYKKTRIVL